MKEQEMKNSKRSDLWSDADKVKLKKLYPNPNVSMEEIEKTFPGRSLRTIRRIANNLGAIRDARLWSEADKAKLIELYPSASREEVEKAIPNKKWAAISREACALKIRRPQSNAWTDQQKKIFDEALAKAPKVFGPGEKIKFLKNLSQATKKSVSSIRQKIVYSGLDKAVGTSGIAPAQVERQGERRFERVIDDSEKILRYLEKNGVTTVNELSELIDKSAVEVIKVLGQLRFQGYGIKHDTSAKTAELVDEPISEMSPLEVNVAPDMGTLRFGVIGETRFGSRYQQLTLLHTAYRIMKREGGVQFVLHTGNLVAGEVSKKHQEENFLLKAEEQKDYVLKQYPRASFKTYICAGQTDLSFKKRGHNIIRDICGESDSLVYRGDEIAKFFIRKNYEINVRHPDTDNIPYAKSYKPQRLLEQIMANLVPLKETGRKNPNLVLIGGTHTASYIPSYGGLNALLVPSFIRQTPKQKRKGIAPTIGFWIVEVSFDGKTNELKHFKPKFYDLTHYQKRDDYLSSVGVRTFEKLSPEEKTILAVLEDEGPQTLGEFSRRLNSTKETAKKIVDRLIRRGLPIEIPADTKQVTLERKIRRSFSSLPTEVINGMFEKKVEKVKLGTVSDPHLCHRSQQPTLVSRAYEIGDEQKVDIFLNPGDFTDGLGTVGYRGHWKDLFIPGADEQVEYVVKVYPKSRRSGIKTKGIPGNHDQWAQKAFGYNIVKHICNLRPDIECLRYPKDIVEINGFRIKLFHPAMGTGYALSYNMQKLIMADLRNMEPGVDVTFYGGWHKAFYMLYAGNHGFVTPCLKGPDEFFEEKGLPYAVGIWIVELTKDRHGRVTRIVPNYYDFISLLKEKDY